jgi:AraC-like DNA-binding protein
MRRSLPPPRGILRPAEGHQRFQLARYPPAPDLEPLVEFYWTVRWDLRGQDPYAQETLPSPSVHLVFERGNSRVWGVVTGKFTRVLRDVGHVFAVKFTPGGFAPLVGFPVSHLTNATTAARDLFGPAAETLERKLLARADERELVTLVEDFLRERLPAGEDAHLALVRRIVACIAARREITAVDDVVARCGVGKRTLQRLFSQYVGVSPKWVIKRYRLHEVAARLDAGEGFDWPSLVVELGYTDQTHLIKDFKAIVGTTPTEYARSARGRATHQEG